MAKEIAQLKDKKVFSSLKELKRRGTIKKRRSSFVSFKLVIKSIEKIVERIVKKE